MDGALGGDLPTPIVGRFALTELRDQARNSALIVYVDKAVLLRLMLFYEWALDEVKCLQRELKRRESDIAALQAELNRRS